MKICNSEAIIEYEVNPYFKYVLCKLHLYLYLHLKLVLGGIKRWVKILKF